jgi:uncharacterized protein (DUF433 family)
MKEVVIDDHGRLAGTRITVYDILDYSTKDHHHTYIAVMLGISSAEVLAGLRYIEAKKGEVMAEYQKMLDRDARGNPPEIEAKRAESRAKLQARIAELRAAKRRAAISLP